MKTLLLLTISLTLFGCSKEDICITCRKGSEVRTFCDGDVDASVLAHKLNSEGFICEKD